MTMNDARCQHGHYVDRCVACGRGRAEAGPLCEFTMTAEEREVIAAAERWHDSDRGAESLPGHSYPGDELFKAVNALRASRTPKPRYKAGGHCNAWAVYDGGISVAVGMLRERAEEFARVLNQDEERRK